MEPQRGEAVGSWKPGPTGSRKESVPGSRRETGLSQGCPPLGDRRGRGATEKTGLQRSRSNQDGQRGRRGGRGSQTSPRAEPQSLTGLVVSVCPSPCQACLFCAIGLSIFALTPSHRGLGVFVSLVLGVCSFFFFLVATEK